MGIFDSLVKATTNAAKYLAEEDKIIKQKREQEETQQKKLDTLRNPMRSILKKGDIISESDMNFLKMTAAKLGIDEKEFEMRFDLVLSAKKEYYGQGKKSLFSSKQPDLFFVECDDEDLELAIDDYFELEAGLHADNPLTMMSIEKKVNQEMQRPHFESAFNSAFAGISLIQPVQNPNVEKQVQPTPPSVPSHVQYTLNINGQNYGPYDMQQMQQMVQSGQLTRQTYVWKQGMANWELAGNVQELAILFGAVPPPPPAMPPAPPTV